MRTALMASIPVYYAALALSMISATRAEGQVHVGTNVQVSAARSQLPHGEVLISADPSDPSGLVACSMYFSKELNTWQTIVYSSDDGGQNWLPTLDMHEFFRWSVDPACTMADDGTAYFVSISSAGYLSDQLYLPVFRSSDGGATWTQTVVIPNTHQRLDREYVVTDNTGGRFHGRIYMNGAGLMRGLTDGKPIGDISLLRSSDRGVNFLGPVKRGSVDRRFPLGPVAPTNAVILSDGAVVMAFAESRGDWTEDGRLRLPPNSRGDPIAELKVLVSRDGGHSLLPAVTVGDWYLNVGSWSARNHASLAADPGSTDFKDRLYLAWTDVRSGRLEILLSYSPDGGSTWSSPRVVNDDPVGIGDHGPDHFMPVVAANHHGVVGVMWYDRRNSRNNIGWSIRFAASLDGGETFLPSVPVSSEPNVYDDETELPVMAVVRSGGGETPEIGVDLQLSFFHYNAGDTAGMAADAAGIFHPLWVDNRTGITQVWTAPVRVTGRAIRNGSSALAGLRDISADVELELFNARADRSTNEILVDARVENTSSSSIDGPLAIRVTGVSSPITSVRVLGADNEVEDAGAVWRFHPANRLLEPGEQTLPRTLRFKLAAPPSLSRGADLTLDLVQLKVRVFADRSDGDP